MCGSSAAPVELDKHYNSNIYDKDESNVFYGDHGLVADLGKAWCVCVCVCVVCVCV